MGRSPSAPGQILIPQLASDTGGDQHIARMRHLQQRCRPVHTLHEAPSEGAYLSIAREPRLAQRSKKARTSSPRSNASTKAEPTTTPSTCGAKRATLLAGADPESGANGNGGAALDPIHVVEHFVGHFGGFAGGTRHGHGVHESLRGAAQHRRAALQASPASPSVSRRDLTVERALELVAFLVRQIRNDEPADARLRAAARGNRSSPKLSKGFR